MHDVLYTDHSFYSHGKKENYIFAQVPYHYALKYFFNFILGKIPEWRKKYSKRWLKKFVDKKYTLIYAFVYSPDCLNYASWISRQKKTPLVIHLADHSVIFEETKITNILINNCAQLICITEQMKSKYQKMLSLNDIDVLHNGAEKECFALKPPTKFRFNKDNPFKLCFIGGLFSNLHGDCVEDVFEAFKIIKEERTYIEFHLYGQLQPSSFLSEYLSLPGVTHHGIVMPLEKKYGIMEQSDCFIIPSSFDKEKNHSYRYSFPTKLPELLVSERPLLSYGPSETATNYLLSKYGLGKILDERSVNKLVSTIYKIMDDYSEYVQNAKSKKHLIEQIFSAKKIREKMNQILKIK